MTKTIRFAVIRADLSSDDLGEILSTHRTRGAAEKAAGTLRDARGAYVAERKADGSWPLRAEVDGADIDTAWAGGGAY